MPYKLFFNSNKKKKRNLSQNSCQNSCCIDAKSNPLILTAALNLSKADNTAWELIDSVAPYLNKSNKINAHQTMNYANFFNEFNNGSQGSSLEKLLHKTKLFSGVTNSNTSSIQENLKLGITVDDIINSQPRKRIKTKYLFRY